VAACFLFAAAAAFAVDDRRAIFQNANAFVSRPLRMPPPAINQQQTQQHHDSSLVPAQDVLLHIDFALTVYFTLYWLLRFLLTDQRLRFIFSWGTAVDVITIIPVYIMYAAANAGYEIPALLFLRILRILRVLRLFSMTRATERVENAITRSAVNLMLTMLSMMLISAGLWLV
jgi:hypothetical protein